jgi:hypothetical protein
VVMAALDPGFGIAVRARDLVRGAIGRSNQFEHVGFRHVRMRGHLGTQIFRAVVPRILNACGVFAGQFLAQLAKILIDGPGALRFMAMVLS